MVRSFVVVVFVSSVIREEMEIVTKDFLDQDRERIDEV
jgi:hypothetical protein